MIDHTVIVVGGGPSGLVVASELAMAGVDVVVIERRTDVVQSRAGTILPRVLELLDSRDLAQRFIDASAEIVSHPLFRSHMWAGMKPVHWKHLDSRHGYRLVLPQNRTEELLVQHAEEVGVRFLRGRTVTDLTQDETGAVVTFVDEAGETAELRAAYVVGCDGGRSVVREKSGIAFEGHPPTFTGIVADLVMDNPWPEGRRIVGNEKGWLASFPFGEGITRFNLVHAERMRAEVSEEVTVDEVVRCLREILGIDLAFETLHWASRFSDNTRIADRFFTGRVFVVGESGRIHYPASGVGMNFCIQDAFNLGWKLAAVVNGHAAQDLLTTYESERRPIAEDLLRSVATQCALQFSFTPDGMAVKRWFESTILPMPEVNRRLALELNGLATPYRSPEGAGPLAGYRLPDIEFQLPGRVTTSAELLRDQRMLALDLTGGDRLRELVYEKAPVTVASAVPVRAPEPLNTATAVLVRPDGYVAWSSDRHDIESAELRGEIEQRIRQWLAFAR